MKISWGTGIAATYIIFVVFTLGMTYAMMTKNVDLVATNYYEKEIKYQQQIDKINNTNGLKDKLKFEYSEGKIVLTFPKIGAIAGEINFYRPSDPKKDFNFKIKTDENYMVTIDCSVLLKGLWKIKIEWNAAGVDYYNEETIII